jgi:RNA polymerase sigma-70 factor (ECF subfamily)
MDRPPPDEQLLAASRHDPQQFAPLFDRHAPDIHRYLARRVDSVADDLLSETFLVAFRQRARYRDAGAGVRAWLFGIATNLVRQHVRTEIRRYRALARLPAPAPVEPDPTERLDAHRLRARIAAALADLKPADRDALLLLAWGELSYLEIAAVQNVPVGTVRSRINRARRLTSAALAIDFAEETT